MSYTQMNAHLYKALRLISKYDYNISYMYNPAKLTYTLMCMEYQVGIEFPTYVIESHTEDELAEMILEVLEDHENKYSQDDDPEYVFENENEQAFLDAAWDYGL